MAQRIAQHILDHLVGMLRLGMSEMAAYEYCRSRGVAKKRVPEYVRAARERFAEVGGATQDELRREACVQLHEMLSRAVADQQWSVAVAARRELNRLLRLYDAEPPPDHEERSNEVALVREHLLRAGVGDASMSAVDLARLAVIEIMRLRGEAELVQST